MKKDEILNDLHSRIVDGSFLPGDTLVERKLCEKYGLSRTPIREILWALVSEGLVENKPSKGFFVCKLSWQRIFEIYQTLEAVEGMAARLACQYADSSFIMKIKAIRTKLEPLDTEKNTNDCVLLGREMHTEILIAGKNKFLTDFDEKLKTITRLAINMIDRKNLEKESKQYHILIMRAIIDKDADKSEMYMRKHLQISRNKIVSLVYPDISKFVSLSNF